MDARIETYRSFKVKLCKILATAEYCCICLENNLCLLNLNDFICISNWEGYHYITVKNLLSFIFGENNGRSSEYICSACKVKSISTYKFMFNSKRTFEILDYYLDQLDVEINNIYISKEELSHTAFVIDDPPCVVSIENNQKEETKKDKKFICDYCDEVFQDLAVLTKHIDSNHMKLFVTKKKRRNFGCKQCKSKHCSHEKYIEHYNKEINQGNNEVKCLDCNDVFTSKELFIHHINLIHLQYFPLYCEMCNQKFPSTYSLKLHKRNIHKNHSKSCDYCCKEFAKTKKYKAHVQECKDIIRAHRCDHCPASFDSEILFKRHVKRHLNVYACDLCLRTFSNQFSLKEHKKVHCSKFSQTSCLYCGDVFESTAEKDNHVRQHDGNAKPYCQVCHTHFNTERDYQNHISSVKNRTKLNCEQCSYQAASFNNLEAHVNRYHLKIMPYKCLECPKHFTNTTLLKLHTKTHSKIRRHQCHICTKMFCGSMALKKHIRLHTGEKPYLCDQCGEGFVSSSLRSDHKLRKHSKEKTVKCPFCDYKFYAARDMREHFKNNHWKVKGEKFDVNKVKGLKPEELELFRDRRMLML